MFLYSTAHIARLSNFYQNYSSEKLSIKIEFIIYAIAVFRIKVNCNSFTDFTSFICLIKKLLDVSEIHDASTSFWFPNLIVHRKICTRCNISVLQQTQNSSTDWWHCFDSSCCNISQKYPDIMQPIDCSFPFQSISERICMYSESRHNVANF